MGPDASAGGRGSYAPRSGHPSRTAWQAAVLIVVAALAVAIALPRLEITYHWRPGFSYDPGTAVAALAAIAGGMLTLLGFAIAAVTLMVQSIQAQSPRLLRSLYGLRGVPVLFGAFVGVFVFTVVVLSDVSSHAVPTISVTLAVALVLISAGLFVRLLMRFRATLTTGGLAREIGRETRQAFDAQFPAADQPVPPQKGVPDTTAGSQRTWTIQHTGEPGVYQGIDEPALVQLAEDLDAEITLIPAVGDFIAFGAGVATGTGNEPDRDRVAQAIRIDPARSLPQDPAYGLRLLADISIRALSPAVNDPTSAVEVLNELDDILRRLAQRSFGSGVITDDGGRCRVRYTPLAWHALLGLALDETLQYGASSIQVARRLQALLRDLGPITPEGRRQPVQARIDALNSLVAAAFPSTGADVASAPDRQGLGSSSPTAVPSAGP